MLEQKITLDRKTFKVLASDTRIQILKKLDEHQQTLTDLALEFNMAPSTIKEHIDKLVEANLIQAVDKGMKWKYYHLTRNGKKILNPYETKVWIVLGTTLLALFVSVYKLFLDFGKFTMYKTTEISREVVSEKTVAPMVAQEGKATSEIISIVPEIPYLEIIWAIILVLILGICIGYLIKRKRII